MNISTSECSSGCESGWTIYLNQSSNSHDHSNILYHKSENLNRYNNNKPSGDYLDGCDEEDEDLSMVSDASSGAPYFGEDDEYSFDETRVFCYEEKKKRKIYKTKEKKSSKKEQYMYLDDSASSSVKNHVIIPQSGASIEHGTHYKGKYALQKRTGIFQSSMSKKSDSEAADGLPERKWE